MWGARSQQPSPAWKALHSRKWLFPEGEDVRPLATHHGAAEGRVRLHAGPVTLSSKTWVVVGPGAVAAVQGLRAVPAAALWQGAAPGENILLLQVHLLVSGQALSCRTGTGHEDEDAQPIYTWEGDTRGTSTQERGTEEGSSSQIQTPD